MHEPQEIRLDDNSRIRFDWTKGGALYVQLLRPGVDRYGHGLLVNGTAMLSGQELTGFLAAISSPELAQGLSSQ